MSIIIGITGLIASGKSTLTKYLIDKKYKVFDSDYEVKKLYDNDEFLNIIKSQFKECFENNQLNKKILANIIFNDINKKKQLENIIHPIIEEKCDFFIESNKNEKIIFIDVPLLFEVNWNNKCDKIILILVSEKIQKQRYINRGGNIDLFEKIIDNQGDIEYKIKNSTYIIENNSSIEDFYKKIDKILIDINK